MSTSKVTKVEFEPPIKGEPVKHFVGWVCVGYCEDACAWYSGCDVDSPADAYNEANDFGARSIVAATVQMFRVDPA